MDTNTNKKGLFLDDLRNPENVTWVQLPENVDWKIVRSFHEFAEAIEEDTFEVISFDHYLGKYARLTGRDCLQHLITHLTIFKLPTPKEVCFHSSDPECNTVSKKIWDTHRLSQELVKSNDTAVFTRVTFSGAFIKALDKALDESDKRRKERNRRKKERQKAKRR